MELMGSKDYESLKVDETFDGIQNLAETTTEVNSNNEMEVNKTQETFLALKELMLEFKQHIVDLLKRLSVLVQEIQDL